MSPNLWQDSPGQQLLKNAVCPLHNGLSLWIAGNVSGMGNLPGPQKVFEFLRGIGRDIVSHKCPRSSNMGVY